MAERQFKRKQKIFVGTRQMYRRIAKVVNETAKIDDNKHTNASLQLDCKSGTKYSDTTNLVLTPEISLGEAPISEDYVQFECHMDNEFDDSLSDSSEDSEPDSTETLLCQLRRWAASNSSVPQSAVTELLHILKQFHPELPLDCRTLLRTPIDIVSTQLDSGEYVHLGLELALKNCLSKIKHLLSVLKLSFNIDGLPLFRSSNMQLWPILGLIKYVEVCSPFGIGIFCGSRKPKPLHLYFKQFIDELQALMQNKLQFKNKLYEIEIHSFICDAPARSFIKSIKSHGGYASCEKCTEHGEYYNGRVIL